MHCKFYLKSYSQPVKYNMFLRTVRIQSTLMSRVFAKKRTARISYFHTSQVFFIKVGDTIPSIDLFENTPENKVNLQDLSKGKKIVLFGVPGAFTPGCSKTHLPGYVEKADEMKKQGIAEIVCVAVNDPFVMAAWGEQHKTKGKVRMLADPGADFISAIKLGTDLKALGGCRSKRFSMIINDTKVVELNVEPDAAGTGLTCTLAKKLKIK